MSWPLYSWKKNPSYPLDAVRALEVLETMRRENFVPAGN
jgi:hypothetical protein